MTSFFGGQPGVSFAIRKNFASIKDMTDAFAQGDGYKDVWYGEYCLIDTEDKNKTDNGKLYRRAQSGAEYIGQIVGPSSSVAIQGTDTIGEVDAALVGASNSAYVTYWIKNGEEYKWYSRKKSDIEEGKTIAEKEWTINGALVPGWKKNAQGTNEWNDSIKWKICNIREPDSGNITTAYVGMEIPYPVFGFEGNITSGYNSEGERDNTVTVEKTTRTDSTTEHPFDQYWKLNFPRGIRGEQIKEIRHGKWKTLVQTAETYKESTTALEKHHTIFLPDVFTINIKTGELQINTSTQLLEDVNRKALLESRYKYLLVADGQTYFARGYQKEDKTWDYDVPPSPPTGYKDEFEIWVCDLESYGANIKEPARYTVFLGYYNGLEEITKDGDIEYTGLNNSPAPFITEAAINGDTLSFYLGFKDSAHIPTNTTVAKTGKITDTSGNTHGGENTAWISTGRLCLSYLIGYTFTSYKVEGKSYTSAIDYLNGEFSGGLEGLKGYLAAYVPNATTKEFFAYNYQDTSKGWMSIPYKDSQTESYFNGNAAPVNFIPTAVITAWDAAKPWRTVTSPSFVVEVK